MFPVYGVTHVPGCSGGPSWPDYAQALASASAVIIPALVLAEVDCFLRDERAAMRKLVAEIFDPGTRYEFEPAVPTDLVRALQLDAKFSALRLGLVDGLVAAVAERRHIYRILTTDRRGFAVLRRGPRPCGARGLVTFLSFWP